MENMLINHLKKCAQGSSNIGELLDYLVVFRFKEKPDITYIRKIIAFDIVTEVTEQEQLHIRLILNSEVMDINGTVRKGIIMDIILYRNDTYAAGLRNETGYKDIEIIPGTIKIVI